MPARAFDESVSILRGVEVRHPRSIRIPRPEVLVRRIEKVAIVRRALVKHLRIAGFTQCFCHPIERCICNCILLHLRHRTISNLIVRHIMYLVDPVDAFLAHIRLALRRRLRGILQHAFPCGVHVEAMQPVKPCRRQPNRQRAACHHVRVDVELRPAINPAALLIHQHDRLRHIFHALRLNHGQQRHRAAIDIPARVARIDVVSALNVVNLAVESQIAPVGIFKDRRHQQAVIER